MSLMSHGMSGKSIPTVNFTNAVTEQFPSYNREYKVESSIQDRYVRDYLPVNANVNTGSVADSYVEFIITPSPQEFIDLSSLQIEFKLQITKGDGTALADGENVTVVDGFADRLLSRSSLFLNSVAVENNSHFGLYNTVYNYLNMKKSSLASFGRMKYYRSLKSNINDVISNATDFTDDVLTADDIKINSESRSVIHSITNLNLDVGKSDFYLINDVEIRLRIDLASPNVLINSSSAGPFSYRLNLAKLWVQKIIPQPSALVSLNKGLISGNRSVEYLFSRPIVKNFILPSLHTAITLENIFNGLIPQQIILFCIAQTAVTGKLNRNSSYLPHANLSQALLEVNGNIRSRTTCSFPVEIAQIFNNTLQNLDSDENLLTRDNYINGRTIHSWDLRACDANDVLPIEQSGNLRIALQFSAGNIENIEIFVVGITSGLVHIDYNRRVTTSYLM